MSKCLRDCLLDKALKQSSLIDWVLSLGVAQHLNKELTGNALFKCEIDRFSCRIHKILQILTICVLVIIKCRMQHAV